MSELVGVYLMETDPQNLSFSQTATVAKEKPVSKIRAYVLTIWP